MLSLIYINMDSIDTLRFLIGFVMLSYGSWSDLKTRRVSNLVWIYGGILGSLLLIYEVNLIWEDFGIYIWALLFATFTLFLILLWTNTFWTRIKQYSGNLVSILQFCVLYISFLVLIQMIFQRIITN